ncbi:hypothetical protein ACR0ST_06850 [Aliidiomarina sp. Khilg15.8]
MKEIFKFLSSSATKREIEAAQNDLYLRKQVVAARSGLLKSHVRDRLATKKALAIAGGSGFLLEQLSRGPKCKKCGSANSGIDVSSLLHSALRILTLTNAAKSISDGFFGAE